MSREIYICNICGEIYDKYKDYENCCLTIHAKNRLIEVKKIELADLVIAWENTDNTKETMKYYRKRSNLINEIKEMENES